ncbi:MAG TPA: cytochrome c3 family protein [Anaerolineales bacterium]|nr:cytochrome c3 family protein [Anaerolineales bacterium]
MNRFWLIGFLLLSVVGVVIGILLTRSQVLSAPEQPIAYSHKTHVEVGIQCLYCHSNPLRSDIAGIPSVKKCMGCHTVIETDNTTVQELAGYWEREEPIPWVRVNSQPDFIYFSHKPHLGAGLNCETCHGDVGQMTVTRSVVKMDMGWCLDCHLKEPQPKATRLADCLACHK